ncbi:MAG: integration host factor subunit beta [Paludibacteraceae bacterium]|nr:integration host factor subunit beta [Paludibacteraceae bacterium]
MTKAELINEIALTTGFDKASVTVIVEAFMEKVKKSVSGGDPVFLRGFGTFNTKTRKAKKARDIIKEISVLVPQHEVVVFKPAADFSERLNNPKKK